MLTVFRVSLDIPLIHCCWQLKSRPAWMRFQSQKLLTQYTGGKKLNEIANPVSVQIPGAAHGDGRAAEGVREHPEVPSDGRLRGRPDGRERRQEPLPGRAALRRHPRGAGAHQREQHGLHQRVAHQSKSSRIPPRAKARQESKV